MCLERHWLIIPQLQHRHNRGGAFGAHRAELYAKMISPGVLPIQDSVWTLLAVYKGTHDWSLL